MNWKLTPEQAAELEAENRQKQMAAAVEGAVERMQRQSFEALDHRVKDLPEDVKIQSLLSTACELFNGTRLDDTDDVRFGIGLVLYEHDTGHVQFAGGGIRVEAIPGILRDTADRLDGMVRKKAKKERKP